MKVYIVMQRCSTDRFVSGEIIQIFSDRDKANSLIDTLYKIPNPTYIYSVDKYEVIE